MNRRKIKAEARELIFHNPGAIFCYFGLYLLIITLIQITSDYWIVPLADEVSLSLFSQSNSFINTLAATFVRDIFDFLLLYGMISSSIKKDFQIGGLFQVFQTNSDLKKWLFCYLIAGLPTSLINLLFSFFAYTEWIDQNGKFLLLGLILFVLSFMGSLWKYHAVVSFQTNEQIPFINRVKETCHVFKNAVSGLAVLELSFFGWLILQFFISAYVSYYWDNPVLTSLSSPAIFGLGFFYVPYYTITVSHYNLQLYRPKTTKIKKKE